MRRAGPHPLAVALLAAGSALAAPASRPTAPRVPVTQPLVILLQDHVARASAEHAVARDRAGRGRAAAHEGAHRPSRDGRRQGQGRQPLGARPAPRAARAATRAGSSPTRRSGRPPSGASSSTVSTRTVAVFRDGRARAHVPRRRAEGRDADAVRPVLRRGGRSRSRRRTPAARSRSPSARARTSSRSSTGGPGQIAIHGTNGLSEPLGSAASHGCIRLSPSADHLARQAHRRRRAGDRER